MSDVHGEPSAPTLERARALAKQLLRECRAADTPALERVRAQLPRLASLTLAEAASRVRLADVQHALARESGVESWAALRERIEASEPLVAQVKRFLHALVGEDLGTMQRVLASHPDVARVSLHTACAACDAALVDAWLARDPSQATATLAGSAWTPLDFLAGSPIAAKDAAACGTSAAIATRLLALGASANQSTPQEGSPEIGLPVLYRAAQLGNAPLVRVLLEHGADPNDGESTYHAAERDHEDVLALLHAHGADFSGTHARWHNTVLYYLAGYRDEHRMAAPARAGMRWLLEHGADPNVPSTPAAETPPHRLADSGGGADAAAMLLAHGADPHARRADGRTAYDLAVRSGNEAVATLLRERGAANTPSPADALFGACARGDEAEARRIAGAHPEALAALTAEEGMAIVHATQRGQVAALRAFVALGFDVAAEPGSGGTALHWAAWHGRLALVRELVALGAPLDRRDAQYGSSPIAWAAHGSRHCRDADDEYVAVIDVLLDAGSARASSFNRWNEPPENLASDAVAEHLRARGFAPAE